MKWSSFTTPPAVRPSPPKQPLFTTKFFSTKSFGPGHIVGAGILVVGVVGLSKLFIARGEDERERARCLAQAQAPSQFPSRGPADGPKLAKVENSRGEYGVKP
jgi:hypothetical protein